jgi:hypothetical protein
MVKGGERGVSHNNPFVMACDSNESHLVHEQKIPLTTQGRLHSCRMNQARQHLTANACPRPSLPSGRTPYNRQKLPTCRAEPPVAHPYSFVRDDRAPEINWQPRVGAPMPSSGTIQSRRRIGMECSRRCREEERGLRGT